MGYVHGCEPLRVWNRIEPRSRQTDFTRVLRAEVHDPLWLLARQWQFGEFKGEDTGSPIFAKLAVRSAGLTSFRNRQGGFQPYSEAIPLEARVEREPMPRDHDVRAQLGRQWLKMLDYFGQSFNAEGGTPAYDAASYRQRFLARFPLREPASTGDGPAGVVAEARLESNPRLRQYMRALAGRMVDGVALADALPPGSAGQAIDWAALPASITSDVPVAHRELVLEALEAFRAWLDTVWTQPREAADTAWDDAQLEYRFACRVPRPDGQELVLEASEYPGGRLDWYAFELGPEVTPAAGETTGSGVVTETFTVIPVPAEFPGQPNARFWQIEDGAVDLGNIRADSTDLVKILVAEFALVYGNNWFVIPCRQRAGSLIEVEGIVVDDVFGQRTLVQSATRAEPGTWARWDMFRLGPGLTGGATSLGAHLLLPPVVHGAMEGEPLEAVRLIRDEIANTVWAVEARVPDGLGRGQDGHDAARRLAASIQRREPEAQPAPPPPGDVALRYVLGTSVPENWIPFIPVHKPGDDRAIRLQRASMPRFFQNTVRPVRPLTRILRVGMSDDERQIAPYFVHEEEVPRAGVRVEASYQRARWYGGATMVWYGRRKRSGRGEGSSGLRFDLLEDVKPSDRG